MTQQPTRQHWLEQAVEQAEIVFKARGYMVPDVLISCGFTSTGIRSSRIGECWPVTRCSGGLNQIFISPVIDDAEEIIGVIFHELVHAVDDCKSGHGKKFKEIATTIGLTGKMIHAHPGEELSEAVKIIAKSLGPYPHKRVMPRPSLSTGRQRPSAECPQCGYRVPMLKKFLGFGPPICPVDHIALRQEGNWPVPSV
jgi:hypothetical protein